MEVLKVEPFTLTIKHDGFTVSREKHSIDLKPNELEAVVKVVNFALGVETRKVLPPFVKTSPFQVNFTAERVLYLTRQDPISKDELGFTFKEGDKLIEAIETGLAKWRDISTIQNKPGGRGHAGFNTPDPIIIGR